MSKQKKVVHLQVYKGKNNSRQLSYDANGRVQNESQLVKLTHNTLEWSLFLKHIKVHGFISAKVVKVLQPICKDEKGKVNIVITYEDVKEYESIKKELEEAINSKNEKNLTEDQKRIAELEAKLESILSQKEEDNTGDELKKAREEYVKVFEKKPHHSWDVEAINAKIKELED